MAAVFFPAKGLIPKRGRKTEDVANEHRSSLSRDRHRYVSGSDNAHWYWSSTEHRDNADYVYDVDFTDGDDDWDHKDNNRLSCRPCRVERVDDPLSDPFHKDRK